MIIDKKLWTDTEENNSSLKLPTGPQVCRILKVEDVEEKEYLKIYFDIISGDFKGYFTTLYDRIGEFPNQGVVIRSYKSTAYSMLKSFVIALEKSNTLYDFEKSGFDFNSFVNKQMVVLFAEEEIPYLDDQGKIKIVVKPREVRSIAALKEGKIKVPDLKKLDAATKERLLPTSTTVKSTDDMPF